MALTFSVPDTELSLTLHNRRNEVVDQVFQGTPFLAAMSRFGGVKNIDGGLEIVVPVRMSKNTTVSSFDGFDIIDVTPQDNETSARYAPTGLAATVSIAWTEELKNMGRGKLIDIVNQKTDDAMMTIRDQLNVQCLAAQPAAGSKDLNSITELIDEAPSADPNRTTAIGSIGNSNTWWRNQATSGGAFTVADMTSMWNDVSDGSDFPDFLLTSDTIWEYYHAAQTGLVRYGDTRMGDLGFPNLLFMTAPMVWDPQIGNTDEIYFINTKYHQICVYNNADFVTTDFVKPDNQMAKTATIAWYGNQVNTNRRRCGTIHGITAPA